MGSKPGRRSRSQGATWTRRRVLLGTGLAAVAITAAWRVGPGGRAGGGAIAGRGRGPDRLPDYITPIGEFFQFSNGKVPEVRDPASLQLTVGDSSGQLDLAWSEVHSWARRRVVRTLQCDGNGYEGMRAPVLGCQMASGEDPDEDPDHPPPENWTWRFGGIGNAEWDVVSIAELFARSGAPQDGAWLRAAGRDGYVRYFPREVVEDEDFVLAVGMNGQALPHGHGAPARLLVPGQYGAMNIKWIEALTWGGMEDTRTWDGGSPNHYPIKPLAFASTPIERAELPKGEIELAGVAFAGRDGVKEVVLWLDGVSPWKAELLDPARPLVWRRWRSRVTLPPGEHTLRVACVDSRGRHSVNQSPYGDAEGFGGIHSLRLSVGKGS